ncbi:MAG: hypothetical protein P1V97_31355, partial [Planctomycetota bacterium]|nr:hypothetical protein [Planctomycetota bacterium]
LLIVRFGLGTKFFARDKFIEVGYEIRMRLAKQGFSEQDVEHLSRSLFDYLKNLGFRQMIALKHGPRYVLGVDELLELESCKIRRLTRFLWDWSHNCIALWLESKGQLADLMKWNQISIPELLDLDCAQQ